MQDGATPPAQSFPGGRRYNAYGPYLAEMFGCRVYKVSVDAGFTCPNRDGSRGVGGCAYCNNSSFRPETADPVQPVPEQVRGGIEYLKRRYRAQKFIVYFQHFSNTYAPLDYLVSLYERALDHPDVVGISVGTRPDCIDEAKIAWFEGLARTRLVTLEYGLESIRDSTLERVNRGHTYACWLDAVARSRGRGIEICAHLILGFPWETRDEMLATAGAVSRAGIDSLKLHHLHVVRNTALGREYEKTPFPLLEYGEYLDLVVDFLERLSPAVRMQRLFGLASEKDLLGPRWGKSKAEIQHGIVSQLARRNACQGRLYLGAMRPAGGCQLPSGLAR